MVVAASRSLTWGHDELCCQPDGPRALLLVVSRGGQVCSIVTLKVVAGIAAIAALVAVAAANLQGQNNRVCY